MSEQESLELLRKARVGRIGVILGPQPYIVPVFFTYHRGRIVFYTQKRGAKLEGILSNPYICLQVDSIPEGEGEAKSVLVFGKAEVVRDPDEKAEAIKALVNKYMEYHDIRRNINEEAISLPEDEFYKESLRKVTVIAIIPRKITGRKMKIESPRVE
ncbi:MAG: pyridoxamine 5'-phosphate oxidase family protein [archaeon GB-1867-005]|nr:pyridoxamine 5'-phosphate oxidase family protein [Candidatus Culexmicrobium cathedralense]